MSVVTFSDQHRYFLENWADEQIAVLNSPNPLPQSATRNRSAKVSQCKGRLLDLIMLSKHTIYMRNHVPNWTSISDEAQRMTASTAWATARRDNFANGLRQANGTAILPPAGTAPAAAPAVVTTQAAATTTAPPSRSPKRPLQSNQSITNIDKLKRGTWDIWCQDLRTSLEAEMPQGGFEIWKILTGEVNNTHANDYNLTLDLQLAQVVLLTTSVELKQEYLTSAQTGASSGARLLGSELFALLKAGLMSDSEAKRHLALTKLTHLQQELHTKIEDHIIVFRRLVMNYTNRGGQLNDSHVLSTFQASLNDPWRHRLTTILQNQRDMHNSAERRKAARNQAYVIQDFPTPTLNMIYAELCKHSIDNTALQHSRGITSSGTVSSKSMLPTTPSKTSDARRVAFEDESTDNNVIASLGDNIWTQGEDGNFLRVAIDRKGGGAPRGRKYPCSQQQESPGNRSSGQYNTPPHMARRNFCPRA